MDNFSEEEMEQKKRAIFDSMGSRGQKYILKKGYDKWDPFEEPKHPIDIRKDKTNRTSQMLIREFLQSRKMDEYSTIYGKGAFDMCFGIINNDEHCRGMFDFACWYKDLLKREGHEEL
jgi:hypothetical protein